MGHTGVKNCRTVQVDEGERRGYSNSGKILTNRENGAVYRVTKELGVTLARCKREKRRGGESPGADAVVMDGRDVH